VALPVWLRELGAPHLVRALLGWSWPVTRRVFVVLTPDGQAWNNRAFGTEQHACGSVCGTTGVYWPQLVARGWRIVPAELRWS
jgi:hypothetical protein